MLRGLHAINIKGIIIRFMTETNILIIQTYAQKYIRKFFQMHTTYSSTVQKHTLIQPKKYRLYTDGICAMCISRTKGESR